MDGWMDPRFAINQAEITQHTRYSRTSTAPTYTKHDAVNGTAYAYYYYYYYPNLT